MASRLQTLAPPNAIYLGEATYRRIKGAFKLKDLGSMQLKGKEKKMIEQSISSVSDQELREILKRVMTKDIIRRRLSRNRKVP